MLAVAPAILGALLAAPGPSPTPIPPELRANLNEQLDRILALPAFNETKVGVYVARLADNAELYSHNAEDALVPASNVKILTTAAALHVLGPDRRFRTEVFGKKDNKGGLEGDLYIKGYGDPWLVPERLWFLANRLRFLGIRAIKGNLVVDSSYFAGPAIANGWQQDRTTNAYMAPAGALSVGFNALLVHVLPSQRVGEDAQILVDPASDYAGIQGSVATVARGRSAVEVDIEPMDDRSVIKIAGRVVQKSAPLGFWRKVDNPAVFAGEILRSQLRSIGIPVRGVVREGLVPANAERLVTLESPRLAELIQRVNKNSNNFMASQLARILGAERFGPPGTWDKGKRAIEEYLQQTVGLAPGSFTINNACGLHDVNRMSPHQMVRVLSQVHAENAIWPEFVSSLAVAGGSGTLSDRMRQPESTRMVRAKTGTLSIASALSGFVTTRGGDLLAFSVMVNDYTAPLRDVWRAQDEIGMTLARVDFGRGVIATPKPAAAPVAGPPEATEVAP